MTIPELVERVLQERLGSAVEVDSGNLTQTYETHEFLIQYQESPWNFIARWMEQEGIFFFLADAGETERLVLADSMDNLPFARSGDNGHIAHRGPTALGASETVFQLRHAEEVGVARVAVSDFDWTNPLLSVAAQRAGDSPLDPAPEVYDHTDVVSFHRYGGQQYEHNTVERGAQIRSEVLALQRERWAMRGDVVTAAPGQVLRVEGAPQADLDGAYMIVRCESGGLATEGATGTWDNSFVVVPTSVQYRPAPRTPRPVVPGPETAIVVGPDGQEIHTDEHGRVKVHFHWDRVQGRTEETSSFWIRVQHNWAGTGFGTFFLPRVGMEVVIAFLGGNPDRPLVTGCVYNGTHASPATPLPATKTQSVIRTKSSQNSNGYNEIRFEDEASNEFIYVHAQKDYNEVVEHCHTTHVKVDQSNTVDHDHTETVGNDQTLHVKNDRTKNVDNDEKTEIGGNRTEEVTGHEQIHIHEFRKVKIEDNEKLVVHGNREMHVDGRDDEEIVGGREVVVAEFDNLKVIAGANRNETISGQYNITVDGAHYTLVQGGTEKLTQGSQKTYVESAKEVHAKTGSSHLLMKNDGNIKLAGDTKIELEVGGCRIEMTTEKITLTAGASSIELGPSGVKTSGSTVTSSAQTMNEITGLLVKIN